MIVVFVISYHLLFSQPMKYSSQAQKEEKRRIEIGLCKYFFVSLFLFFSSSLRLSPVISCIKLSVRSIKCLILCENDCERVLS